MKIYTFLIISLFSLETHFSISQKKENDLKSISTEKKKNFIFNEFNLSINKWSKIGFGGGMYHQQHIKNRVSSIIGIEYNQVSHFYPTVFRETILFTKTKLIFIQLFLFQWQSEFILIKENY